MTLDSATMRESAAAQFVTGQPPQVQGRFPHRSRFARVFGFASPGTESMSWYLGAEGGIVVDSILATLPPEWTVLQAVAIGSPNAEIDHLVIGPGGIFTITTKHKVIGDIRIGRNTLRIDGETVPYLRSAEFEAERITSLVRERMPLLAPVQPVIVFVDPRILTIEQKPAQVKVLDAEDLRRWLVRLHPVLSAGEVQEVADLFDSPDIWRPLPDSAPDELGESVAPLDAPGRSAGIQRMLWVLLAAALTIAVGYVVLQLIEKALATA